MNRFKCLPGLLPCLNNVFQGGKRTLQWKKWFCTFFTCGELNFGGPLLPVRLLWSWFLTRWLMSSSSSPSSSWIDNPRFYLDSPVCYRIKACDTKYTVTASYFLGKTSTSLTIIITPAISCGYAGTCLRFIERIAIGMFI